MRLRFSARDPCGAPRNAGVQGGTESSNLLCSSGESANSRSQRDQRELGYAIAWFAEAIRALSDVSEGRARWHCGIAPAPPTAVGRQCLEAERRQQLRGTGVPPEVAQAEIARDRSGI
jgi:hypothetical protein